MATLEEYRAAGQALRRRVFGAPQSGAKSPTQELAPDLGRWWAARRTPLAAPASRRF